jgi:hypothetical protein
MSHHYVHRTRLSKNQQKLARELAQRAADGSVLTKDDFADLDIFVGSLLKDAAVAANRLRRDFLFHREAFDKDGKPLRVKPLYIETEKVDRALVAALASLSGEIAAFFDRCEGGAA